MMYSSPKNSGILIAKSLASYALLPGCCNSVPVGEEIPKGRCTGTYEKAGDKRQRKTAKEAGTVGAATGKQAAVRRKLPVENGE